MGVGSDAGRRLRKTTCCEISGPPQVSHRGRGRQPGSQTLPGRNETTRGKARERVADIPEVFSRQEPGAGVGAAAEPVEDHGARPMCMWLKLGIRHGEPDRREGGLHHRAHAAHKPHGPAAYVWPKLKAPGWSQSLHQLRPQTHGFSPHAPPQNSRAFFRLGGWGLPDDEGGSTAPREP